MGQAALQVYREKGLGESLRILHQTGRIKSGRLVGVDKFGNQYFENRAFPIPRDRWVVYRNSRAEVDASQIPPEWHQWMHHMTDLTPDQAQFQQKSWMKPHEQNKTWTSGHYSPPGSLYREDRKTYQHYEPWTPGQKKQ